jgi:hypothetical protein
MTKSAPEHVREWPLSSSSNHSIDQRTGTKCFCHITRCCTATILNQPHRSNQSLQSADVRWRYVLRDHEPHLHIPEYTTIADNQHPSSVVSYTHFLNSYSYPSQTLCIPSRYYLDQCHIWRHRHHSRSILPPFRKWRHFQPRQTFESVTVRRVNQCSTNKDRSVRKFFANQSNEFDEMFGITIGYIDTNIFDFWNSMNNISTKQRRVSYKHFIIGWTLIFWNHFPSCQSRRRHSKEIISRSIESNSLICAYWQHLFVFSSKLFPLFQIVMLMDGREQVTLTCKEREKKLEYLRESSLLSKVEWPFQMCPLCPYSMP